MVRLGASSSDELPDLLDDLLTVPAVAALPVLPVDMQCRLAQLVLQAIAGYRSARAVQGVWHPVTDADGSIAGQIQVMRRGRPPKLEVAPFVEDCVAAWAEVTGDRVEVWFDDANESGSVTMQIASAALGGRGDHVGVSGLKKWARKASEVRRRKSASQD